MQRVLILCIIIYFKIALVKYGKMLKIHCNYIIIYIVLNNGNFYHYI